jgi:antitoxin component of MazEF toxin-antitoxin module
MTKLCKWGNSYAVRIPRDIVQQLILMEGDDLTVELVGDSLKLTKAATAKSRLKLLMQRNNQAMDLEPIGRQIGLEEW